MFFFCSAEVSLFNKILKHIEAFVIDFKVLSVEISLLHAQPFINSICYFLIIVELVNQVLLQWPKQ